MAHSPADLFKENTTSIVDEVDSVLIDDARTPLIIWSSTTRRSS
jgi:preprotein translocase subunit SecA